MKSGSPPPQEGPQLKILTEFLPVGTQGHGEMVDVTTQVQSIIKKHGLKFGTVTVFCPGSTGSVTTIEYEPGLKEDFPAAMERLAPSKGQRYKHDDTWHDGNGHSHVRASTVGPSLTVPIAEGKMTLGTWQQIVFVDWDNKPRRRDLVIQLMGTTG
ncbi:YjbQ family protein [bacterium]|nr:YjbQ family protein [bacterium]